MSHRQRRHILQSFIIQRCHWWHIIYFISHIMQPPTVQNLSPQERRHITLSTSSPAARFRFQRARLPPVATPQDSEERVMLYSMHADSSGHVSDVPTIPALVQTPGRSATNQMISMTQETHAQRLALEDSMASETGTQTAYARHLKRYETWWISDQTRRREADSELEFIPPHPITATKVALFLEYETVRPKVSKSLHVILRGTGID